MQFLPELKQIFLNLDDIDFVLDRSFKIFIGYIDDEYNKESNTLNRSLFGFFIKYNDSASDEDKIRCNSTLGLRFLYSASFKLYDISSLLEYCNSKTHILKQFVGWVYTGETTISLFKYGENLHIYENNILIKSFENKIYLDLIKTKTISISDENLDDIISLINKPNFNTSQISNGKSALIIKCDNIESIQNNNLDDYRAYYTKEQFINSGQYQFIADFDCDSLTDFESILNDLYSTFNIGLNNGSEDELNKEKSNLISDISKLKESNEFPSFAIAFSMEYIKEVDHLKTCFEKVNEYTENLKNRDKIIANPIPPDKPYNKPNPIILTDQEKILISNSYSLLYSMYSLVPNDKWIPKYRNKVKIIIDSINEKNIVKLKLNDKINFNLDAILEFNIKNVTETIVINNLEYPAYKEKINEGGKIVFKVFVFLCILSVSFFFKDSIISYYKNFTTRKPLSILDSESIPEGRQLTIGRDLVRFVGEEYENGDLKKGIIYYVGKNEDNRKSFEGVFKNNLPQEGVIIFNENDEENRLSFRGKLRNNSAIEGNLIYKENDNKYRESFKGSFKNNQLKEGLLIYSNKDTNNRNSYDGTFSNNLRDGQGLLLYKNGFSYKGEFKNDLLDGNGQFNQNDGYTIGIFKDDICIDGYFYNNEGRKIRRISNGE